MTTPYTTVAHNIEARQDEPKIRKYELLLSKIAMSFGFSDKELSALVQQVYSDSLRHLQYQENFGEMRMVLSKIMVQKCIFKISSEYFSSRSQDERKPAVNSLKCYSNCRNPWLGNMALSLETVFVLDNLGFNETEIAKILNTSMLIVKERLNKVMTMGGMAHKKTSKGFLII